MPRFSIIIPTFNRHRYIREAVDAILSQNESFEVIVKDGGEPCLHLLPKDPRIVYVHSKDRGITHAMNTGFKIASGEIFCWANDDDIMKPDTLKYVSENIGERMWMYGRIISNDETWIYGSPWDYEMEKIQNRVPQPAVFWKRKIYETLGEMDESCDLTSDYEYWLRIGQYYEPLYTERFMATYRHHPEQLTNKRGEEQARQAEETKRKYKDVFYGTQSI